MAVERALKKRNHPLWKEASRKFIRLHAHLMTTTSGTNWVGNDITPTFGRILPVTNPYLEVEARVYLCGGDNVP